MSPELVSDACALRLAAFAYFFGCAFSFGHVVESLVGLCSSLVFFLLDYDLPDR